MRTVELALLAVALLLVAFLVFVYLRRLAIASRGTVVPCGVRTRFQPRWRLGLLRFNVECLEWFSVSGPSMAPVHTWGRPRIDVGSATDLRDVIPGLRASSVQVTALDDNGVVVDLAVPSTAYTVLRAWAESSPPGHNVNVA